MRTSICGVALLALLATGCGDSSGPGDAIIIEMRDGEVFSPPTRSVAAGTTVRWRNVDNVEHNTTSTPAGLWASGNITPGGNFSRVFDTPGTFNYECTIHPGMNGTITVTAQ